MMNCSKVKNGHLRILKYTLLFSEQMDKNFFIRKKHEIDSLNRVWRS